VAIRSVHVALNASTPTPLLVVGNSTGQLPEIKGVDGDELPLLIQNLDPAIVVYLGGPDVSATNGLPLAVGATVPMMLIGTDIPYAISASGTPSVCVFAGRQ